MVVKKPMFSSKDEKQRSEMDLHMKTIGIFGSFFFFLQ